MSSGVPSVLHLPFPIVSILGDGYSPHVTMNTFISSRNPSRREFIRLAGAAGLGFACGATARAAAAAPPALPSIEVEKVGWGGASTADIRAVLKSTASELWRHCGPTRLEPLRVQHRKAGPITIFQRAPDGRVRIGLSPQGQFWSQFAYQFAHEFAHTLAAHTNDWKAKWHSATHANHWLEESIAETASLFAMRAMAKTWETEPPYPNWKSYAPSLAKYVADWMADPARQRPAGQTFAAWFAAALPELRKNPVDRTRNAIIAQQLLPLFEREPSGWEAVTWLNLGKRVADNPFPTHLAEWQEACPKERKKFVDALAGVFAVKL